MPLGQDYATQPCSIARTLEVVGERWTLLVVRDCFFGLRRFTDFQRHLGIPRAVLATRLESLVAAGVLARTEASSGRPEYELTPSGRDLWPVVHAMWSWGEAHATTTPRRRTFRHAPCDVELDTRGRCPACGALPEPAEVTLHPGPAVRARDDRTETALAAGPRLLMDPLLV